MGSNASHTRTRSSPPRPEDAADVNHPHAIWGVTDLKPVPFPSVVSRLPSEGATRGKYSRQRCPGCRTTSLNNRKRRVANMVRSVRKGLVGLQLHVSVHESLLQSRIGGGSWMGCPVYAPPIRRAHVLSNLLENLTQPLLGTRNVPRPYSSNPRSFTCLALPCIMLLCTLG
jgi:hypothetical protein